MLASGYLKVNDSRVKETSDEWDQVYELSVTNFEVLVMLKKLVRSWLRLPLQIITSLSKRCCKTILKL